MAERANYQSFLFELCDVLGVPRPDPANGSGGDYRFERGVTHHAADGSTSNRRIDLYRRACFVLEAKQGSNPHRQAPLFRLEGKLPSRENEAQHRANVRHSPGWTKHMLQAKGQAERYARDLPHAEGWPPFLMVCDVGFCIDLYADFSGFGKHYAQFNGREGFRIYMPDLRSAAVRARLRQVWEDPQSLNPALHRQAVTREIAALLATLARALEGGKAGPRHTAAHVATFLMRCIFCMFAQNVGLLPPGGFTALLKQCQGQPPGVFVGLLADLWRAMDNGGFCAALASPVRYFNGGLFHAGPHGGADPLRVTPDELALLIQAAGKDWAEVEPAIFGTLLENALDPGARAQLGAQFTPRAFVERLVLPTVMEPLRADWDGAKAAAIDVADQGQGKQAAALVRAFHARLCTVRVLDPACGSGNFLYVTLELMKRLEGEVLDTLAALEGTEVRRLAIAGATVDPHQFLGLDVNPRAVPVAELVLWIGYLQWHFRTHGNVPPAEPILRDFRTIVEADALITYTEIGPELDRDGKPLMRWGGRTRLHPITCKQVPDETDRVPVLRPVSAKPTPWPDADFIVGNPPFVAGKDLRTELGSGYAEVLWAAYPEVPPSADLAMFFWWRAAQATREGKDRRFGFITSNSIRQVFCRRVVAAAMQGPKPLHLVFAIPDHPWSQGVDTAAVRIAMTVVAQGDGTGRLQTIERETMATMPEVVLTMREGVINADLTIGMSPGMTRPLRANHRLASMGVKLHGSGFIISPREAQKLGLGSVSGLEHHIRSFVNGRDINQHSRSVLVIDLFGLSEGEVRRRFPDVFQHILLTVKPERDANTRAMYRDNWWIFGEPRREARPALIGLSRYIATAYTAKHRIFSFQAINTIAESMVITIALDTGFSLGVLSSRVHELWTLGACSWIGSGNDPRYNKSLCFNPFPFPAATIVQAAEIAALAEEIDALRKTRLAAHPNLTLTTLYNVLSTIRSGQPLSDKDKDVLHAGQVELLRHLHDRLDSAVAAAYGWPVDLSAAAIVERVVALNHARAAEEADGQVRWLRPGYQAPAEMQRRVSQASLDVDAAAILPPWPKLPGAQFVALRAMLGRTGPSNPADLARHFDNAPGRKISGMLRTLTDLGQARDAGAGRYAA